MNNEERCIKCVIPRLAYSVEFDEKGCCEICNNNDASIASNMESEENIKNYINEIKLRGKGHAYDCLIGVSGGRDSAYLLYILVKKHNLRCLAAYYKTPFTPNIIDNNIKMLTKKLNVPLVEMNISRINHKNIARKMLLSWIEKPNNIIANLACAACKQVNHEVYKIAQKMILAILFMGVISLKLFRLVLHSLKKKK